MNPKDIYSKKKWPKWYVADPLNLMTVWRVLRVWFPIHLVGCLLLYLPMLFFEFQVAPTANSEVLVNLLVLALSTILLAISILAFSFSFTIAVQVTNSFTNCFISPSVAGLFATTLLPLPAIALLALNLAFNPSNNSKLFLSAGIAVQVGMYTAAILFTRWKLTNDSANQYPIRFSISKTLVCVFLFSILIFLSANLSSIFLLISEVFVCSLVAYGLAAFIDFLVMLRYK